MKKNLKTLLIFAAIAIFPLLFLLYDITSSYRDKNPTSTVQEKKLSEADKLIKVLEINCKNKISADVYNDINTKENTTLPIKVLLHVETKPNIEQIIELDNVGATIFLDDTWVAPTESIRTGHFMVEITIKDIESLCKLQFVKLISSGE